ncbi:MAG: prolipoprotein diacylglyceryl transferase [Ruminococcus sp.]|nr:prolipoprotein diacylglyceryl transferase [Ruminococcus sp.]
MTEVERITDPYEIVFPKLGCEFHINPTAFTVFGIEIQWYGIIITLGLILAMLWCFPKMKSFGLDSDRTIDVVIGGVIGGIIGARIYYVLLRWDEYSGDWKSILNFRGGGLAIYGGLIGAIAVGLLMCKIRKVKVLPMLDISVVGFLIGQGIGRWGNFVNQEAFGTNTDSILGMTGGTIQQTIINESAYLDGSMYQAGIEISESYAVHPCFLYESLWCILGFILLSVFAKHRKYDGQMFLMYLTWYGAERFVVEGLRTDSLMIGNLRVSQALSAILVIVSVILQIIMASRVKRDPEGHVLYCNTYESKELLAEAERRRSGSGKDNGESGENTDSDEKTEDEENEADLTETEESADESKIIPDDDEKPGDASDRDNQESEENTDSDENNDKENENGTDN